jgi:hypothetical protein
MTDRANMTRNIAVVPVSAVESAGTLKTPKISPPFFDWGAVPSELVDNLRRQTDRIRARLKITATAVIEFGRDLTAVKQQLSHGMFCAWVEAELGINRRTAQTWMVCAAAADKITDPVKSEKLSLLPPATLYKVCAPSVHREIVERVLEMEVVDPTYLETMLRENRKRRKFARVAAARVNRKKAVSLATQRRRDHVQKLREEERERRQAKVSARANEFIDRYGTDCIEFLLRAGPDVTVWDLIEEFHKHLKTVTCAEAA